MPTTIKGIEGFPIQAWGTSAYGTGTSSNPSCEGPSNAFDGNNDNKYVNFGGNNSGVIVRLSQAAIISSFTLTTANDYPVRTPNNYSLEGSNDGNTWDSIKNKEDITLSSDPGETSRQILTENTTAYPYYRLTFNNLVGNTNLNNGEVVAWVQPPEYQNQTFILAPNISDGATQVTTSDRGYQGTMQIGEITYYDNIGNKIGLSSDYVSTDCPSSGGGGGGGSSASGGGIIAVLLAVGVLGALSQAM